MPKNLFTKTHVANNWSEHVWSWGPDVANLWKVWFDRQDTFESLMANVEIQVSTHACRDEDEELGLTTVVGLGRSTVAPKTRCDH